jgi:flagellar export protein FliJ
MTRRRIDTLRRIRELQERQARVALAAERGELRRVWAREAAERAGADALRVAGGASVGVVQGTHDAVERALAALAVRHLECEAASERVARCERAWSDAARRAEMIERLAERQAAEARADEDRRAREELDEIVVTRHGRHDGGRSDGRLA